MTGPSARSLILDLLSTLRRGTMPVGALVEAGALFGLPGNNVRVALTRLLATRHVARDQRGCYRLGPSAAPLERRVRSWRDLDRAMRPWPAGTWLAVYHVRAGAEARRRQEEGRERALRLFGFRALRPGLSLRPDNLRTPLDELHLELQELGLPRADLMLTVAALDAPTAARAPRLWRIEELRGRYRQRLGDIERSERRLANLGAADAMVETFRLGGQIIRELVLDPLLPDAISPPNERHALVQALHQYDRLGRLVWADFLKRFDVPHIRTPLDSHLAVAPARLAV